MVVEDDENLAGLITILLKNHFTASIQTIHHGWTALDTITRAKPDLLILDVMLPGLSGLEICRKVRQIMPNLPIIMLTAKSEDHEKLEGFEKGADDYITKPFNHTELIARIKALLRRSHLRVVNPSQPMIQIGELTMDARNRTLLKNGKSIELTSKEFDLVHYFMKHPGRPFSRADLLMAVWGEHFDGMEHTVNSTINRIRVKIETDIHAPEYILTAWGIGYKFREN
jgi:two-component system, OmpR family, response regulator